MERDSANTVEVRLRAAVESAPSGLLMVDADGRIVLVNREVERMFGYSREELLGKPVEILVPERFRGQHPSYRKEFFAAPKVRSMGAGRDLYGRRKDGSEVPVEIGLNPIATDDGFYVLSAIVDITARRRAEEERRALQEQLVQSQKMEAVGTLAGGVAHDFNNILAAILGYGELLRDKVADTAEASADLDEIIKAATRGKQLVERILAFSRRREKKLQPVSIEGTVGEAVKLLRATIPATVDIQTRWGASTPSVLGDPTSIHQVLMNLGNNAVQAMPTGGKLVVAVDSIYVRDSMARSHPDLHEGLYALLTVRDTGQGMDRRTMERVFEPFFTTKRPGTGTGLGLAVVHSIMREHDGAVLIDSAVGQGTVVQCYFPGVMSGGEEQANASEEWPRGAGQRVLYVEDEPMLARIGLRRLERLGYRASVATDSREALSRMQSEPEAYDAVITDYWMPTLTGLDLAREIHSIRPDLPIILLTGFMEDLPEEMLTSRGIRRVLNKPTTTQDLAVALHTAIQGVTAAPPSGTVTSPNGPTGAP